MKNLQFRFVILLLVIAIGIYFIIPTFQWYFIYSPEERQKKEISKDPILKKILNLGLDLKGGVFLILEIDKEKIPQETNLSDALDRAIEIIRNRVDQYGVAEAIISKQGDQWISVQLPGLKDPQLAKELIGKTALLEFRLVNMDEPYRKIIEKIREIGIKPKEALTNPQILSLVPTGYVLLPGRTDEIYLVKDTPEITGAYLTNARVELGASETGLPYVSLEFNQEGAKIFAKVTELNIEKHLAIVLDNVVQSAPIIRSRIPDGRAIIEGDFTLEEAKFIATVLRAGALPAPVKIIEERTVGPTLGKDSVISGRNALIIGSIVVLIFMIVYYKISGVIANIALMVNIFLVLSALTALKATLSFPGLAGIVLLIGVGVDANILILERIKEEIKNGKTLRVAIDLGYQRALQTIVDSNLTTLITTVFLFGFGTGPIKGFGITMFIGLIANIFTAVFMTKLIYDYLLSIKTFDHKVLF
ncbi:MAG: protein translocase subunit SecD [Elusimicrobiota bacterium]|nr:protein translocase subunit SecD [Endomicrobiia bacterium]MDW8165315.1 protein translocase subunit SecD [Elusimicrobiota bacterium]